MTDQAVPLRVVEYATGSIAVSFAAAVLGALGADVVKVEPPDGDPLRGRAPRSVPYEYTSRYKRTVSGQPAVPSDVVLTDRPTEHPGTTIVVTPFGLTGPWAGWRADAAALFHAGGVGYVTPRSAQTGSSGEIPPQAPAGHLAEYFCGLYAAMLALAYGGSDAALVDLSMQDCLLPLTRREVGAWLAEHRVASRSGRLWQVGPSDFYPAADGWVYVSVVEDEQWRRLLRLCGVTGEPPAHLATARARFDNAADVEALIGPWLREHTSAEIFALSGAAGVPVGPAFSPADLVAQRELWRQGALTRQRADLVLPELVPAAVRDRGPLPGGPASATAADRLPLRGWRIVEFTHVWAGPLCGQFLADLGAEVIKVESHRYLDVHRRAGPYVDGTTDLDGSTVFRAQNRGKLSCTLDLKTEQGRQLALRLVAGADVVLENFRPGTLARLGLDLATLRQAQPRIVLVSLSGYGQTGQRRDFPAYGPMMDAVAGLSWLSRDPTGRPQSVNGWFPDVAGALYGAVCAIAEVRRARHTGQGGHVDIAELHSLLSLLPELFVPDADWQFANRMPDGGVTPVACGEPDTWLVVPDVQAEAATRLAAELGDPVEVCRRLQAAGVGAVPVLSARDLLTNEHLLDRRSFRGTTRPAAATTMYAPAWVVDGRRGGTDLPPPGLGEHTHHVLCTAAGCTETELERLVAEGILY
ncbi:MAG TPA: CoA transferase [Pseudonocardiaceae bacterium]|nr:CoA transferase [Pseudonocardiaceae bacterium]